MKKVFLYLNLMALGVVFVMTSNPVAFGCSSAEAYVETFQRTLEDLEEDLLNARKRGNNTSRYNLEIMETEFRESMPCVEKVCSFEQQKLILKYWNRFMEIRKSGALKSPKPLVDPYPRRY